MPAPIIVAAVGIASTQIVDWAKRAFHREEDMLTCKAKVELLDMSFPPDPSTIIDVTVKGVINPVDTKNMMALFGYKCGIYDNNWFQHLYVNPDYPKSVTCRQIVDVRIDPGKFEKTIDFVVFDKQTYFSVDEIRELRNREMINDDVAYYYLHKLGYRDYATREAALSLRREIPPIADLIRFAVRDAFNPQIVSKYGYAEEYPKILDKYIAWQGLGWPTGFARPGSSDAPGFVPIKIRDGQAELRVANLEDIIAGRIDNRGQFKQVEEESEEVKDRCGQEGDATWGEIAWYAHWDIPSPTQGYEMLHKLYPESRYGPSPYVLTQDGKIDLSKAFTESDLSTLLKTSDYPVYWRKRLEAISYLPLTRVDVRRMFRLGLATEADVYHNYRAQGYDDRNAKFLTEFTLAEERRDVSNEVCAMFKIGIISEDEGRRILENNRMSKELIDATFTECKLNLRMEEIKKTIEMIRKSRIEGQITEGEARGLLAQTGIQQWRLEGYINQWELEIKIHARVPTLQSISRWYVDGIISEEELISRLQKLRYSDSDINRIVKQMRIRRLSEEIKSRRKEEKERESKQKEFKRLQNEVKREYEKSQREAERKRREEINRLEKERKDREKMLDDENKRARENILREQNELKEAVKNLIKTSTDKNLISWFNLGLISLDEIMYRLKLRGYSDIDAERWVITYLGENKNAEET